MNSLEVSDLGAFVPSDPEVFSVFLRLMVGPRGEEGQESFDVRVCSPGWLKKSCEAQGFVVGRHLFIVNDFDWPHIKATLTELIERCAGDSWRDVAEKVGRVGYWEFEDYNTNP